MFERVVEITVLAYQQNAHKMYLWVKDKTLASYVTDDLEILIATMDRDDLTFLETIFSKPLDQIHESVLIVNQSKSSQLKSNFDNIRILNDANYGLSRSRNLAIKNAKGKLLWILDDDCVIVKDAVEKIVIAHSVNEHAIITFQTVSFKNELIRDYSNCSGLLAHRQIKKVLSPEITIKKSAVVESGLMFNIRFGLGAQFQDGENYVLLLDAIKKGMQIFFVPEKIIFHKELTSSDEVDSNRIIYARGAIAARRNPSTAQFYQWKYAFFLWRKGYIQNFNELVKKFRLYGHGMEDYVWGFESHRNHHLDL